jgi:glycosyltransferase involved in cell wall biosynthesis
MFFRALRIMFQYEFHLVHAVEESALIASSLKKFFGIPYIYDMDSSVADRIVEKYSYLKIILPILKKIEKSMINGSLGVIPVCKYIEDIVLTYDPNKLVQRLEDISLLPKKNPEVIDENKKLSVGGSILMYIGNMEKYQGIDLLIESFNVASKVVLSAQLVLIGGEKTDIKFYKKLSADLGISDKTIFMGPKPLSDLAYYLAQADILVSPRIKGYNTPMKIYSYLDSSKAVLATRLFTHTQVLDDEVAYLVDPDVESMANGMVVLLKSETLRNRLGKQAKQRAQLEFTLEAYQSKLLNFYRIIESKIAIK